MASACVVKNLCIRRNVLVKNYVDARISGKELGFTIRPEIDITGEEICEVFYVLITPRAGIYKDHFYVLRMSTKYGSDTVYYYPIQWPHIVFTGLCFHTNINPAGGVICLDILKKENCWSARMSFTTVITSIMQLLDEPNVDSPWNLEATSLYKSCLDKFHNEMASIAAEKDGGVTESEKDVAYAQCMQPFKQKASAVMLSNPLAQYKNYFPKIAEVLALRNGTTVSESELAAFAEEERQFNELASQFTKPPAIPRAPINEGTSLDVASMNGATIAPATSPIATVASATPSASADRFSRLKKYRSGQTNVAIQEQKK